MCNLYCPISSFLYETKWWKYHPMANPSITSKKCMISSSWQNDSTAADITSFHHTISHWDPFFSVFSIGGSCLLRKHFYMAMMHKTRQRHVHSSWLNYPIAHSGGKNLEKSCDRGMAHISQPHRCNCNAQRQVWKIVMEVNAWKKTPKATLTGQVTECG